MAISAETVFISMYYALDAASDSFLDKGLATFVEDANPFVWKDRSSADPAVFEEFKRSFDSHFRNSLDDTEQIRLFCREWLSKERKLVELYDRPHIEAFDCIATPSAWRRVLSNQPSKPRND